MKARKKRLDLKEKFCIPPQSNIMRNSQPLIDPHSSGICSLSDRILRNFQIRKWRKRSGIRFPLITTISSKNRHTQKKKKRRNQRQRRRAYRLRIAADFAQKKRIPTSKRSTFARSDTRLYPARSNRYQTMLVAISSRTPTLGRFHSRTSATATIDIKDVTSISRSESERYRDPKPKESKP